jgi:hypothetical protein
LVLAWVRTLAADGGGLLRPGEGWTIRAGIKMASWAQSGSTSAKRAAIGNSIASLFAFALW